MKVPSKVTPYKDSTFSKFPIVLEMLQKRDMSPSEMFYKTSKNKIKSVEEFTEVLDCLYAMGKLEIEGDMLHYVG